MQEKISIGNPVSLYHTVLFFTELEENKINLLDVIVPFTVS